MHYPNSQNLWVLEPGLPTPDGVLFPANLSVNYWHRTESGKFHWVSNILQRKLWCWENKETSTNNINITMIYTNITMVFILTDIHSLWDVMRLLNSLPKVLSCIWYSFRKAMCFPKVQDRNWSIYEWVTIEMEVEK